MSKLIIRYERKKKDKSKNLIIAQIALLLEQAETALVKQDYAKLKELITQMREIIQQVTDPDLLTRMNEKIFQLEKTALSQTKQNSWPLIIGSVFIIPLGLGIFLWLARKWVRLGNLKKNFKKEKGKN